MYPPDEALPVRCNMTFWAADHAPYKVSLKGYCGPSVSGMRIRETMHCDKVGEARSIFIPKKYNLSWQLGRYAVFDQFATLHRHPRIYHCDI